MKKITSILCALALALSVNAAPMLKSGIAPKPAAKSIHFAKTAKAPQIRKASHDVNILSYDAFSYYGYLIIQLQDADGVQYNFGFDPDIIPAIEDGVTYTLDDMFAYFCYWVDADKNTADFTEVSFVKTTDGEGKIKVIAVATDANGDVWNLTYDEASLEPAPEGGTFATTNISKEYYSSSSDVWYQLAFTDDRLLACFDIVLPSGQQDVESGVEYTYADMDTKYTYIKFNKGITIELAEVSFTKTVAADKSYTITVVAKDVNDNVWNLSASKAAPSVTDIKIDKGVQFMDYTALSTDAHWQVIAKNEDYSVALLALTNVLEGTYTEEDLYADYTGIVEELTGDIHQMASANIVVTDNGDGSVDFKGVFVDTEDNTFNLDIHYAAPTAETTVDVVIADAEVTATVFEAGFYSYPGYVINGEDENGVQVSLQIVADDILGDFTEADLWENVAVHDNGEEVTVYTATISITADDKNRTIVADLLGYNSTLYKVTMTAPIPEPQDFNYSMAGTEVDLSDEIADSGYWLVSGNDGVVEIFFSNAGSIDHIVGTYTEADLDAEYSYVEDIASGAKVMFQTITLEITQPAENVYLFHAEGVGKDGNNYTIDLQFGEMPTAVENAGNEIKAVKVFRNGQLIINRNGELFNVNGARVK